jgi:hypothetical protein
MITTSQVHSDPTIIKILEVFTDEIISDNYIN